METLRFKELSKSEQKLLDSAAEVMENAYNPYSHFYVGAALRADGQLFTAANMENASYGASICAERSALSKAFSEGYRTIECVALIARAEHYPEDKVTSPCGICRQVYYEAAAEAGKDIPFLLASSDQQKIIKTSVRELLPLGFGPSYFEGMDR